eukprot:6177720-Pleurochrysis_carterae.AAC.2
MGEGKPRRPLVENRAIDKRPFNAQAMTDLCDAVFILEDSFFQPLFVRRRAGVCQASAAPSRALVLRFICSNFVLLCLSDERGLARALPLDSVSGGCHRQRKLPTVACARRRL